jgi:hypothetical protein
MTIPDVITVACQQFSNAVINFQTPSYSPLNVSPAEKRNRCRFRGKADMPFCTANVCF